MTLLKQTSLFTKDQLTSSQEDFLANPTHKPVNDLENEGYEVQSYILLAAGVGAPHQRYRTWFVAYSKNIGQSQSTSISKWDEYKSNDRHKIRSTFSSISTSGTSTNSNLLGRKGQWEQRSIDKEGKGREKRFGKLGYNEFDRWQKFPTEPSICGGNDGLSKELDGITFSKWRNESIKAYGNAIVPQVAYEIFKAINEFELMQNK